MKCPHCGGFFVEVDGNAIKVRVQDEGRIEKWESIELMPYDPFMPMGTCAACMRGDCELAKRGISHT